ncbi:MAG TPA: CFI-box-CTERM domain-containing protein [Candidatus Bathyarchaeia archaeon]|nr:CFI-box-CTERM domain-containing protein [Candidatus Bathyarchaeia archaeon]
MGSRKQLVLASLVSLMMALAFVIGLMPLHGALPASAASSGPGRIDMVDLLNAVLNLQAGEATQINVSFPAEGANFVVPDITDKVFVNFQASAVGDPSPVAYAINPDLSGDELNEPLHLDVDLPGTVGVAYGFQPPYNAVLDMTSLLLEPVTTVLSAYAFANAALEKGVMTTLVYSVRSGPTKFSVTKIALDIDPDKNGLPTPLTAWIGPGQQWRASYLLDLFDVDGLWVGGIGYRNVAIANLNEPTPGKQPYGLGITVSPEPGVFVTSPTFEQLLAADGNYVNEGEEVFLIATTLMEQPPLWASALQLAISEVDEVGDTEADIATWAAGVEAVQPPGGRAGWTLALGRPSPYVEIALLAVDTDDTYREVETLPDTLPVVLELQNLDVDGEMPVQMWSYLSWIKNAEGTQPADLDYVFTSVMANLDAAAPIYEWDFVDQQIPELGGSFIAELTSLSIFGAFESAMSIYAIYPDSASTCADPGEVNIVGTFGVEAGVSAEDLEGQFDVFFGDLPATIFSAAEVYAEDLVRFSVEAPVSGVAQVVDVTVVDTTVAANLALLEQAFEYYDIFTLEAGVQTLDADGNSLAPPLDVAGVEELNVIPLQDTYLAGDAVNLEAVAAENYVFVQWLGDVGDIEDANDDTTTLTFGRDETETCDALNVQITAQFQYTIPITEYFLTINVNPVGGGAVELDSAVQPLGVELGPFAPGTEVDLNAIAENCYEFDDWVGPVANPASAETTLTFEGMDATIEVTANFVPICYTLDVIEDPDEGGDVLPADASGQYMPGDSVTLEAFPNIVTMPQYFFVHWMINEADVRTENPLTLNFSDFAVRDISVRAVFRQNPILTILDTEGGTVDVTSTPPRVSDIPAYPDTMIEFAPLTEVTLTAVPDGLDFEFVHWEFDPLDFPENAQPDPVDPVLTFIIRGDVTVRAVFTSTNFLITDITPDHAWLFGGVVANIRGTGFMPQSSQLRVYGAPVVPLEVTATDIWFVVPPTTVGFQSQSLDADVTVSNPPFTNEYSQTVNLRYDRYATSGTITTTAFRYAGTTVDTDVALGADLYLASLILPSPQQSITQAYGLIRATKEASLVEADNFTIEGTAVANAWNFGIHLYNLQVMNVGLNTGAPVHPEITNWTYERAEATVPARLEFTVADTTLTAAAVRNDVMMWSVDTRHNYGAFPYPGADTTTLVEPANTDYQSTLEQLEVLPNVTPDSPDGATPITSVVARLYDLTAFALRIGVQTLPAEFVDAMSVDAPGGTVSGPTSGGTQFTVDAPLGGLAWVTVGFAESITAATPASDTRLGTVIDNGETEFSAIIQAPKWPTDTNTTVDVAIYLNSNLDEPLIIFENAFRYTKLAKPFPCEILLLLLGLLAALIGLAAGGDSGDGGGPCFIATAAYGTPMAADIDTLRALRDTYLLESSVGTAFVDAYYRVSPAIAGVIAQSPVLAAGVRLLLLPVIFASKFLLSMPAVSLLALGVAMTLARIRRRGKVKA